MKPNLPYVGIMVATRKERKAVLQQYCSAGSSKVRLFSFLPSGINWSKLRIKGLQRRKGKWIVREFPFPKVVYNRSYQSALDGRIQRLEQRVGKRYCFNLINHLDKLSIHSSIGQVLVHHLPATLSYDRVAAYHLLKEHRIIYLKPVRGNRGTGVYRIEQDAEGIYRIGDHYYTPIYRTENPDLCMDMMDRLTGSRPYLVQQEVPKLDWNGHTFDIRAMVQKNGNGKWAVTNVISRIAYQGSFNTSLCESICYTEFLLKQLFPEDQVIAIRKTLHETSLRAAELIESHTGYHLGELSIDYMLDPSRHVWIIEANGKPQKDLYDELGTGEIVYKRPIQYAHYLLRV